MNRIEGLVDAISMFYGFHDPSTDAYKLRNPILIRSFARPGKHEIDEQGRRVFNSLISGYRSAIFDIELKVKGQSRAGLKPDDTIENLLGSIGIKGAAPISTVVKFLRVALSDDAISAKTPLSYFGE